MAIGSEAKYGSDGVYVHVYGFGCAMSFNSEEVS